MSETAGSRARSPVPGSPLRDPKLEVLLERLHARSDTEQAGIGAYVGGRARAGNLPETRFDDDLHRFFADKMVALDRDKALLCYQLCRALRATRVVEAGTSFGVSTLYLAAAVRDNLAEGAAADGVVIGTEHEPEKAKIARANFEEAELASFIDLREGDLRESLRELPGAVDFVLLDIWDVALDALRLVAPRLRAGAVVACDNTRAHAAHYRDYFAFVADPANRLRTLTLPYEGGFELTVRTG
jgi:predicted O-methyltransferase YrrM